MKPRLIRPWWQDKDYIIGNEKNGFIGNRYMFEKWEAECPCDICTVSAYSCDSSDCPSYSQWLSSNPLRRVGKAK
jgi:hypothetical protein